MMDYHQPNAESKATSFSWPNLFDGSETINASILTIEKVAEGLPDDHRGAWP